MEDIWALEGMIEDVVKGCDFPVNGNLKITGKLKLKEAKDIRYIARPSVMQKMAGNLKTCFHR